MADAAILFAQRQHQRIRSRRGSRYFSIKLNTTDAPNVPEETLKRTPYVGVPNRFRISDMLC